MGQDLVKGVLGASRAIRDDAALASRLPAEATAPDSEPILPKSLLHGTRGYLEKVGFQVNACYLTTAYDGCAVMVRRLLESLLVEVFEHRKTAERVKGADGNYVQLGELVVAALSDASWGLSRNSKRALGRLKEVGDLSAHNRRYNAKRQYIDELVGDLRVVTEELAYLAGLK